MIQHMVFLMPQQHCRGTVYLEKQIAMLQAGYLFRQNV